MPTTPPPDPRSPGGADAPTDEAGPLVRFGATAFEAAAFASLAAAPVTYRIGGAAAGAGGAAGAGSVWLAMSAVVLVPMFGAIVVSRGARDGLRALAGPSPGRRLALVVAWGALFGAWLTGFGAVLRATTHHRALSGVTFAVVSLGVAAGLAIAVARASRMAFMCVRARAHAPSVAHVSLAAGALVLSVAVFAARLDRDSAPAESGSAAELAVDLVVFIVAVRLALLATASRHDRSSRRALAFVGPPLAAAVLVAGVAQLRSSPPLAEAAARRAPAYEAIVRLFAEH